MNFHVEFFYAMTESRILFTRLNVVLNFERVSKFCLNFMVYIKLNTCFFMRICIFFSKVPTFVLSATIAMGILPVLIWQQNMLVSVNMVSKGTENSVKVTIFS
jgi:hypothetical protein